ncbi:biopolymer transporter ExbD [Belnapia rosea]|uniref:Biopolymer transport protein TolR n=1 Tax=Belnapia rosea TaxID=938405 RepID=A0A1G6MEF0_9PROT|nr:biopolymer transporter ExbD [Belnapia rosea]SDC53356.1 biopolymer transport protein TolR [Belnapia rosea]
MSMQLPAGGDSDDEGSPVSDINVTPLVDVMLVLLVIFMVTAPMMTAGIPLDLPRTAAAPLSPPKPPLELSITLEGALFLDKEPVPQEALEPRLAALHAEAPDRALHLRADRGIDYGEVLRVMGLVQRAGISKLALVSMPGGDPVAPAPDASPPAPSPTAAPGR